MAENFVATIHRPPHLFRMEEAEYYKMAGVEDRMWYYRSLHGHCHRLLRQRCGTGPCDLLDAGCGSGGLIRRLQGLEPAWRITGLDVSPLACTLARRRCRAPVVEGSVTGLPFAGAAFDAIVSADVLYELDEPAAALREFHRCLRPGGWIVVNVPAYRWLWSYHDVAVRSKHRFMRQEVADLLTAAGFAMEVNTHWNALPFPLIVAKRKLFRKAGDTSDVKLYPAPVEAGFRGLMAVEHAWLRLGGRWAWGSSILAVGQKLEGRAAYHD
ncbi:MAG: class I SAM-dependent methyltransferase [Opitutaceae bacterium]|nr:class I SAM-dependent methyltransferase [Opitutaceae bacterium]